LRQLYEAVLANTPDLGYVFDLNHRFAYADDALLAMWGLTWEEAAGKNCLELGYEPSHAAMQGLRRLPPLLTITTREQAER
jgi:PAS domain S-box-containing protein